jgi:predicted SAM-dependent methyltransferase
MRQLFKRLARAAGYDIRALQVHDLPLYYRLYPRESVDGRRFYNVGAGAFRHPAWTNVDFESAWYSKAQGDSVGISWDLMAGIPVSVGHGTAELVYSSHTVEHVTDAAAANLFREAHRILKPGGRLRVTMPDIDLDVRAYRENDREFFYWTRMYSDPKEYRRAKYNRPLSEATIQQLFLSHFAFSASTLHADGAPRRIDDAEVDRVFREMPATEALDYCVSRCSLDVQKKYPGNHINWWNGEKALRMLDEAGFSDVYRSAYGQSRAAVLRNTDYFDSTHPKLSLYVEARKTPA